ncbi:MAG: hypothetical protein N3B01_07935 [Verrucomicrobiae bacterium]|nr:hypothetical protein [Verrucomicrobiae bacterium]
MSAAVISSEHAHAIGFYPNGTYDGAVAVVRSRDEPDVIQMPVDSVTARVALSDSQL